MFAWKIWNAICGTWKRDFNTRHTIVMTERGGWKLLISTMCEHLTQFSFWFLFIFWCDVTSHNGMRVNKKYILCLDEGKIIRDMNIETYNVYWCSLGVEHKFIKNHMMINCLCTNLERHLTALFIFHGLRLVYLIACLFSIIICRRCKNLWSVWWLIW